MKIRNCRKCKKDKDKSEYSESSWNLPNSQNPKCRECQRVYQRRGTYIQKGFIYVVTNPAWSGWCKIGLSKSIENRTAGMNTYSPFRDFEIVHSVECNDMFETERTIHQRLRAMNIENNYEWFRMDTLSAIRELEAIKKVIEESE